MAARDIGIFKVKVTSIDDKFCHFAILLDLTGRTVREIHVAAGTDSEFRIRDINEPFNSFIAWVQEVRYYYRVDPNLTQDLERMVQHLVKNAEFLGKLFAAFKKNSTGDLDYDMSAELIHILGDKTPRIEIVLGKKDPETPEAAETEAAAGGAGNSNFRKGTFLPMGFVMAPINGTYLPRVPLNASVVVKFIKTGEASTKTYIKNHPGPDEEHKERAYAILKELNNVPGTTQVQAIVELPGGQLGEIVEESQEIKIKLAPTKPPRARRFRQSAGTEGGYSAPSRLAGFSPEFSLPFIVGSIFAVSLLLGVLVVLLSYL